MQSIKTLTPPKGPTRTEPVLSAPVAERLAELFGALGDPTRLRIISALLAGERNVGDIAAALGMTQSAVSHQLRSLRQIHVVRATKLGREVYYALDDDHVADLFTRGLDHVKHG